MPQHQADNRPMLEKKFSNLVTPFQRFMQDQVTASMILIVCTLLALFIANSSWALVYQHAL
ncbi:MAG: sodium:proton antiporter, partial [Gammaproteobacteria bacterium]|nr:sodium:proton antiporter [Gammaproteobacteria bacterium]NIR96369.1 sodium:proton antiporter [Gammaproteobacteria bacterium]NIW47995.1 sodium:proton antiporter [Gammaproteobacteria bacterium]NIX02575.1 sodium:proton antiporter [Phycisphaerae bacterium]